MNVNNKTSCESQVLDYLECYKIWNWKAKALQVRCLCGSPCLKDGFTRKSDNMMDRDKYESMTHKRGEHWARGHSVLPCERRSH